MPTRDAHTKHPTDGYAQKVHLAIAQKLSEFVSEGMTEVHEVEKALRQYVHTQFSQQYQCQPLPSDRAFHPSLHDLRNHVHKAKKPLELSKIDQENLRLKLNSGNKKNPMQATIFAPTLRLMPPNCLRQIKRKNQASQEVSWGIQEVTNVMNWQKPTLNALRHFFGFTKQIGKSPS